MCAIFFNMFAKALSRKTKQKMMDKKEKRARQIT